jgi:hypothetical protein
MRGEIDERFVAEGCFLRGAGGAEERVLLERLEGEASEVPPADAVPAAARAIVVEHDHQEHGHVGDHHQRHQPRAVVPLLRRRLVVVERRLLRLRLVWVRRGRGVVAGARVVPPRRRLDPRRRLRPALLHVGVRHRLISRAPTERALPSSPSATMVRVEMKEEAEMTTGDSVSEEGAFACFLFDLFL